VIEFSGQAVLLDIEGTTSSIRFVYDEMFPFVRRELDGFLDTHWESADVRAACDVLAADAGHASLEAWRGPADDTGARQLVSDEVKRLMDGDIKATGLKQLQGLIWRSGFESGELRAHVYDDVPPALKAWHDAGMDLRIYSSGSIAAQRLFFGHTIVGDLLPLLKGHYDTTTGPKKEPASYVEIAQAFCREPEEILFLSDVVGETAAARQAGMQTALCLRPGNAEPPADHDFATIHAFTEIRCVAKTP
jgi:enolase-phosphatase E1